MVWTQTSEEFTLSKDLIIEQAVEIFLDGKFSAPGPLAFGSEREFPTVDPSRPEEMVGSLEIVAGLAGRPEWRGRHEVGLLVEAVHSETGVIVMTDSGMGQLEIVYPVSPDLPALSQVTKKIMPDVLSVARDRGLVVLGLGRHPIARGTPDVWIPKPRYLQVRGSLDPKTGSETTETASDQTTIDAWSPQHAVDMVNVGNYLAPLIAPLCANAAVFHGKAHSRQLASRVRTWERICKQSGRIGIPTRFRDVEHYVRVLLEQPYLFHVNDDDHKSAERFARSFWKAVRHYDKVSLLSLLKVHISCVWWEARIRLNGCTSVEFRTPCRQLTDEQDQAVTALYLGLATRSADTLDFIRDLGWRALRNTFAATADVGLSAKVRGRSVRGPIRDMLAIARQGLTDRNKGEARYLQPLEDRLEAGRTLAEDAIELFGERTPAEFCARLARKHEGARQLRLAFCETA